MNRSADTREYVVSSGGIGTAPTTITVNSPVVPPRKGWIHEIQLRVTAGPATQARAVVKVGTQDRMVYEDPVTPGGLIDIDGTGAEFHFADIRIGFERGPAENITVDVETDDVGATTTVEVMLRIGGP